MLLATDLDGTFLGGRQADRLKLYRLIREQENIRLMFVTGRGIESVMPLLDNPVIPDPDYIICDVGATILNGQTLEPVQPIQSEIENQWPGTLVIQKQMRKIKGLRLQPVSQQRRCSFFYDERTDIDTVKRVADEMGLDVLLSAGRFLDILPKNINKGSTLKRLVKLMQFSAKDILVAGDTLNDRSLYDTQYKGVVVGAAEPALMDYTNGMPNVLQAKSQGAGGILESMKHFPEFSGYVNNGTNNVPGDAQGDTQLLVLYHRLPYEMKEINGTEKKVSPKSPNGIIPSLLGFFSNGRTGAWIAWEEVRNKNIARADRYIDENKYPNLIASSIPLTKKEIDVFYKLFSKEAFWPVIFSFADKVRFNHEQWEQYVNVNRLFAERAAAEADKNATVWIHEYNLWMVPGILRQLRPDVKIGFFHHTAFPPADIFNIIPWRREIIGSMLQCDYIGFHIPRYVENFVDVVKSHIPVKVRSEQSCADRFLTYSCALGVDKMTREIDAGGRIIRLGAHPVGINMKNIRHIFEQPATQERIKKMQKQREGKQIILSVERLDYVKGPLEKINAFQSFLERNPHLHGKVELINICTPPASGMKVYDKILAELEQAIGKINGKYARLDWVPIHFFFRSVPFEEVITYYAIADVAWITPLRDGLNLVAKEYIGVQGLKTAADGVLVISEFAGASVELSYAIRTNPYDIKDLVQGLEQALALDQNERKLRMERLFEQVTHYDIDNWGKAFMHELENIRREDSLMQLS
ncbi:glucosylglycerol-phosphate synthase [Agriterribacter sp.]|uniref:glucosylglycerol-phosphate synthase n=1 Tax=Agriterribacter sp. TaxID=2821509 RepID=UPI002B783B18|nr:glucosylglycerol-phosphate synthase [Agriterribacter sp.]HRO45357.1 glucosylglycerol-phosphate synthase [Agriterribacter sp.]HRQ16951.1 glucosylglycerol-phosphate synthase [Agriterribacter sp.]